MLVQASVIYVYGEETHVCVAVRKAAPPADLMANPQENFSHDHSALADAYRFTSQQAAALHAVINAALTARSPEFWFIIDQRLSGHGKVPFPL